VKQRHDISPSTASRRPLADIVPRSKLDIFNPARKRRDVERKINVGRPAVAGADCSASERLEQFAKDGDPDEPESGERVGDRRKS